MTTPLFYAVNNTGYNKADNTLVSVSPAPRMITPLAAAEQNFYGDSSAQFNGMYSMTLEWNIVSAAERASLLTQYGLSTSIASNKVTHALNPDRVGVWTRYNAQACYDASEKPVVLGFSGFKIVLIWVEASS